MIETKPDLEARVRRLERSNHLLVVCCLALASGPYLLGLGGQAGQPKVQLPAGAQIAPQVQLPASAQKYIAKEVQEAIKADRQVHNVLRARAFALVDRTGAPKAFLSTDERGDPMLTMLGVRNMGRDSGVSMALGLVANQPECVFYGYDDKPRAGLYAQGEGRDRLPTLTFAPGGQILMKHANGNLLTRLMSYSDVTQWDVNDKDNNNLLRYTSGTGAPATRISQLQLTGSQSGNTATLFAGPSLVSIGVNSKGSRYHASMSAEGTQGIIRGRGKNGPMDQVFSSKWRSPLHDQHSWQINPTDPF